MRLRRLVKRALRRLGWQLRAERVVADAIPPYDEDGLRSMHNHSFESDTAFAVAYQRALQADPGLGFMRWRLHVALWAAAHASALRGDFVECGVNRGYLSSGIMKFLDWNSLDRRFYLFDTFNGIDVRQLSKREIAAGRLRHNEGFVECFESVSRNFSEFQRVTLVRGIIPESLHQVSIDRVAYLSLDLNCAAADVAAFRHFWPLMVSGGIVLLDDFAYAGFEPTHEAILAVCREMGVRALSLPTGQGLVLKP